MHNQHEFLTFNNLAFAKPNLSQKYIFFVCYSTNLKRKINHFSIIHYVIFHHQKSRMFDIKIKL